MSVDGQSTPSLLPDNFLDAYPDYNTPTDSNGNEVTGLFGKTISLQSCCSCILTADFIGLGQRLLSLDILEIDRDRWYEAKHSENVRAVIGILKGEQSLSEETRKRRRTEEEA